MGIPPSLVGRAAVARANHVFPAVVRRVRRAAAESEQRDSLGDEPFRDIPAHRQALEAAPLAGLEKRMADINSGGLSQLDGKAPARVGRIGC